MMLRHLTLNVAAAVLFVVPAFAGSQSENTPASNELAFLEQGKDYVIRFPDGHNILRTTKTETTRTTFNSADGQKRPGKRASWTTTFSVRVFHLLRFGGGSWVMLRHPSDPADAPAWFGKRRAMTILKNDSRVASIEAESNGQDRLKELRARATRKIKTSDTWFNLNHAIAIADVPTEDRSVGTP